MKYFILDLDNCIADDAWRIPKIDWTKFNSTERYHDYHLLSGFDDAGNLDILEQHLDAAAIIFTARPAAYRALTQEWLKRQNIPYELLFMRHNDDHRHSLELKRAMLLGLPEFYGVDLASIVVAYDDRADVVEMYRKCGLTAHRREIHNVCAYTPPQRQEIA